MAIIFSEKEKILVISTSLGFQDEIMDFAIQLSGRTECQIFAVSLAEQPIKKNLLAVFASQEEKQISKFKKTAWAAGTDFKHIFMAEEPGKASWELCHKLKRVDFIITDDHAAYERIKGNVTVPVYKIKTAANIKKGFKGGFMGKTASENKNSYGIKTLIYGIISVALYAAVFTHAEIVMSYFTKGGLYSALPIVTVFIFSFVHGAFAGNLWSLLGIEAVTPKACESMDDMDVVEMAAAA
ncbi:hypothetical protein [Desulforegula conservatrix]|uniref:hypothetical protein n=1 Tax=Desulforegula conservatrix TaxID=153026 RepID=UPI00041A3866|nr:hypothetical protein [Desulforegula conservatrix]